MSYSKPANTPVWAETGDKTAPSDAEILEGWPFSSVPPSRQRFNWLLNWLHKGVRYLMQRGIPEWANDDSYPIGARVQYSGLTYSAKTANTNMQPDVSPSDWERWGWGDSGLLPRVDSILSKNVAGGSDITLTATEANNGTLLFTGALTANINIIVPNTGRRWVVNNGTSGAFTLSVKTASGSAIAITQGLAIAVYCDGANTVKAVASPVTTAVTQAAGDNTTNIATTAFVQGEFSAKFGGSNHSLSSSGYQELPGGLIMQWTTATISGGSSTSITWPIAFPNACFGVTVTGNGSFLASTAPSAVSKSTSGAVLDCASGSDTPTVFVFAIGF